jgi:hypothetical protein
MKDYKYQPLPREDCIRLIFLKPGQGSDPVHIYPLSVPLSEAPEFEALSYTWGFPEPSTRVLCGPRGESISIRDNLLHALCHLRDRSEIRKLWVDAVSINQYDNGEKETQVKMMGLIYWQAVRVVVWLGLDNVEECSAADVFGTIRDTAEFAESQLLEYEEPELIPTVSVSELEKLDAEKWTRLACFFKTRPWFERGWVIQELGLAADAILLCGNVSLDLATYFPFVRWIYTKGHLITDKFGFGLSSQYLATEYWFSTRTPDGIAHLSFLEVLQKARSVECSDDRDYVYAFLGHPSAFESQPGDLIPYVDYESNFTTDSDRKLIIDPDYRKPPEEVYTELAKNLLIRSNELTTLSYVAHSEETLQDRYASWAPRWDLFSSLTTLLSHSYYDASRNSVPYLEFHGSELILSGIEVDTVAWGGEIWDGFSQGFYSATNISPDVLGANRLESLWNTYQFWLRRLFPHRLPDRLAFLQTLTAGAIKGQAAEEEGNMAQFAKNAAAYELQKITAMKTQIPVDRWRKLQEDCHGGDASRFLIDVQISESRVLFLTKNGRMGLGHGLTSVGDRIYVLKGAKVPFILRECEEKGRYKIVSEAYVHGIMRGEAFVEHDLRDITIC